MLEFTQLEQFIAIVEEGTISKAAEKLLISQPALTRSIQRLEEELGLKLFDHHKNKISLNDNGKLAIKLIENLLQQRDQVVAILQAFDKSHHTISIGSCAPAPIWGLRYFLKQLAPLTEIEDVLDSDETFLLEGLKNHTFSLIVLNHPVDNPCYEWIELFQENLYLCVPPTHPLALFPEVSFNDLNGESVLLFSKIGFWNEICVKKIPQSHLLIQEDQEIFNELTRASTLLHFRSNVTLPREKKENRIPIPITDPEAKVTYYAIYEKRHEKLLKQIEKEIKTIDWSDIIDRQ